jgi:hypothetical protein
METEQALEQLKKMSFSIHPLSDIEWNDFASVWKPFECKRKVMLTKSGETERYLFCTGRGSARILCT